MKHQWKLQNTSEEEDKWACHCDLCGDELGEDNGEEECSSNEPQHAFPMEPAFPLVVTKTKEEAMAVARFWLALNKQDYCNN